MGRLSTIGQLSPWLLGTWGAWKEGELGRVWNWNPPTLEEEVAARERRRQAMMNSNVPWIVSDIGSILSFYDDAQDIVSFAKWNRRLFSGNALRECMSRKVGAGMNPAHAAYACACPFGSGGKRRMAEQLSRSRKGFGGLLGAALLRLFPLVSRLAYPLLLFQVTSTVLGWGVSLGPIIGAASELFFRGLHEIGLPFGPEHNKYHQLQRARLMHNLPRGWGAMPYVERGDRLTGLMATQFAFAELGQFPEIVIQPQDYPDLSDVFRDPFGVFRATANVAASLLPNALAYVANELVPDLLGGISKMLGGSGERAQESPDPLTRAMLGLAERNICTSQGVCVETVREAVDLESWVKTLGPLTVVEKQDLQVLYDMFGPSLGAPGRPA